MLSFSACFVCVCVCVLFIYTISISIVCVLQEEPNLIASNQQIWLLQANNFWREKTLWKVNFWYQWIIDSCCENIAVGVNIYLYGYVGLLVPECAMCLLCVFVFLISNESTSKKSHHVSDLGKLDTLLHKT